MSTLSSVKNAFRSLGRARQDRLLSEIYGFSQEMREFLESRLLNVVDEKALIDAMEKETMEKIFHRPMPRTPDGRKIRSIIARAKKLQASEEIIMKLERLAFEGFVEFLNEYGGGPDSFDGMACDHLETYLQLVKKVYKNEKQCAEYFNEVRQFLENKNNMCTEYLCDILNAHINK